MTTLAKSGFARLDKSAYRSSGMATWLGATGPSVGDVGPSLYSGTAGIGWALAEYARETRESWAAELAVCAIRHAVHHARQIPASQRFGFYAGWSGIIFAGYRAGVLLDEPELRKAVEGLASALESEQLSAEFDLMVGAAGAAFAFAVLAPVLGERGLAVAQSAAEHLRLMAKLREQRAAWTAPGNRRNLPLTGMAHGAAGVGAALLELWSRDRTRVWLRNFAESAFEYEAWCFSEEDQNWPDLRHYSTWRATRLLAPPSQAAWCHGAGGVALSRARAFELTGDVGARATADLAARTLYRHVSARVDGGSMSTDLCHGIAGAADTLQVVAERIRSRRIRMCAETLRIRLVDILALLEASGQSWEPEPGLMIGNAGVASYLASDDSASRVSPLLPDSISRM